MGSQHAKGERGWLTKKGGDGWSLLLLSGNIQLIAMTTNELQLVPMSPQISTKFWTQAMNGYEAKWMHGVHVVHSDDKQTAGFSPTRHA